MVKSGLVSMAAVFAFLLANAADAVPLTYVLEGTVTQKSDQSHLVDMVQVGDKVAYSIVVDTQAPDLNITPGFGQYQASSAVLWIGNEAFGCEAPLVDIVADSADNPSSMFTADLTTRLFGYFSAGYFRLVDPSKTLISSVDLPTSPYATERFVGREMSIFIGNPLVYGDYSSLAGSFDRFSIIPEPASFWLLLTCAKLMCVRRRR